MVGFLVFWSVFTSHMTGNTAHLGMALVQRHWLDLAKSGLMIPIFLLGSLIGRCVIEYCTRRQLRRAASLVLLIEAIAISEVLWLNASGPSDRSSWISLFLLSLSMGLQTAALTRVGPLTVHTTFVTGMLNSLAQRLSIAIFWIVDAAKNQRTLRDFWNSRAIRQSNLLIAVWFAYLIGATLGAILTFRWHTAALFLALGLVFASICIDQLTPLAIAEEQEEAKLESQLRQESQPNIL